MKFPVIDFIDIVVDDFKNNGIKIQSLHSVLGNLNRTNFFKNTILPEISIDEYAQLIFGVFFKITKNYTDAQLENMFKNLTYFIWCTTSSIDTNSQTCNECHGSGAQTCDWCAGNGYDTCTDCDGSGQVTDDDDNTEDCYDCDGSGRVSCNVCDGDGEVYCYNCGGDGQMEGNEYIDYRITLEVALTNKSEYNTLKKNESNNDPKIIDIVENLKYQISLYDISGTLEEGDTALRYVDPDSSYFFGLLKDSKKNDKYSNLSLGYIEYYV